MNQGGYKKVYIKTVRRKNVYGQETFLPKWLGSKNDHTQTFFVKNKNSLEFFCKLYA